MNLLPLITIGLILITAALCFCALIGDALALKRHDPPLRPLGTNTMRASPLSLEWGTLVFVLAAHHLIRRALRLVTPRSNDKHSSSTTSRAIHNKWWSRHVVASVTLFLLSVLLLSAVIGIGYFAATLHILQPLLLTWFTAAFIFTTCILEAQFLHFTEKLRLLLLAPISGIVLPVGFVFLSGRALIKTLAAAGSDSSTVRS